MAMLSPIIDGVVIPAVAALPATTRDLIPGRPPR
ncbi:hypothetical protein APED_33755 [Acanthopleuribacter pedis]